MDILIRLLCGTVIGDASQSLWQSERKRYSLFVLTAHALYVAAWTYIFIPKAEVFIYTAITHGVTDYFTHPKQVDFRHTDKLTRIDITCHIIGILILWLMISG